MTRDTRNRSLNGPIAWMGTLIDGMRDNSGQMYMRNRYYDPASGRFTQEDPIGLAGGLNTYGFAEGDAVNYSDPFGLKVCVHAPGLRQALANALQGRIEFRGGCVTKFTASAGSEPFKDFQERFRALISSQHTINVRWGQRGTGSHVTTGVSGGFSLFGNETRTAFIDAAQIGQGYPVRAGSGGYCGQGADGRWTLESLLVHEVLGHLGNLGNSRFASGQGTAVEWENAYYRATPANEPDRCDPAEGPYWERHGELPN